MKRIFYALAVSLVFLFSSAPSSPCGGGAFAYTLDQMKVLMNFKPAPLLTPKEKENYRNILDKRKKCLNAMDLAVKTNNGKSYYDSMKMLLLESTALKETTCSMKLRLSDALDRLYADFEVFGDKVKSWPAFAKAEEEKLRKGRDLVDKIKKIDDLFFKYIHARQRTTYEICVIDPETFEANGAFLKTGARASREILNNYEKLVNALIKADEKARSAAKGAG
jgi:hypothetical protein